MRDEVKLKDNVWSKCKASDGGMKGTSNEQRSVIDGVNTIGKKAK